MVPPGPRKCRAGDPSGDEQNAKRGKIAGSVTFSAVEYCAIVEVMSTRRTAPASADDYKAFGREVMVAAVQMRYGAPRSHYPGSLLGFLETTVQFGDNTLP